MNRQPKSPDFEVTRALIHELIRTGLMLSTTLASLIESVPEDAYPDEDFADVVVEMVVGSCVPTVQATGLREARTATALVGAVRDRVISDLKAATRLAAERED